MLDRFTSMQIFIKVINTGSFSAAGRALNLSPTMITKHINALEHRLSCTLLNRTTRKLSLTEAGILFYQKCETILNDLNQLEQSLSDQNLKPNGRLKINAPISLTLKHLPMFLKQFQQDYPHISIELELTDRIVDLVEEGWDLALRIGKMISSSLKARKLTNIEFELCASPTYLELHGIPKTIKDLTNHQCLQYSLGTFMNRSIWKFGEKGEYTINVNGPLTANNGDILKDAAMNDQGIIYIPKFLVHKELQEKQLQSITLDVPLLQEAALYVIYAPSDYIPPKVRVMIDSLVDYFSIPPWN